MRKKFNDDPPTHPASPVRTLSATERGAVERQLRAAGQLRPATADELAELRKRKSYGAAAFLLFNRRRSQKVSSSSAQ